MPPEDDVPGLLGRPFELAFWIAFIVGVPLLGLLVLGRYTWLGGGSLLWFVALGTTAACFVLGAAVRHRLVSWGEDSGGLAWITLAAVSSYAGFGAVIAVVGLNGALDRSEPRAVPFEVREMSRRGTDMVLAGPDSLGSVTLEITPEEFGRTSPGHAVVVLVRDGRFGLPWIDGYRLTGG